MELSDRGMGESGMLGRVTVKDPRQGVFSSFSQIVFSVDSVVAVPTFLEFTWVRIEVPPWKYIYIYIHQVNMQSIEQ